MSRVILMARVWKGTDCNNHSQSAFQERLAQSLVSGWFTCPKNCPKNVLYLNEMQWLNVIYANAILAEMMSGLRRDAHSTARQDPFNKWNKCGFNLVIKFVVTCSYCIMFGHDFGFLVLVMMFGHYNSFWKNTSRSWDSSLLVGSIASLSGSW